MIKTLIVIPTYDNKNTIVQIAKRAEKTGLPLVVVNDGSTDGSEQILSNLGLNILNFARNRGKGAAILSAAKWAEENGYSHIITIDADGQHLPEEALRFIPLIEKNPNSIIVGNRIFNSPSIPTSSRFGRQWSNLWLRITSGFSIPDSQSGFRAYPVSALLNIPCSAKHYNFEVEILAKGAWAGLIITHTDISVLYSDETKKASHFKPFLDNLRISWTYTKLVIRNFIPIPHKKLFSQVDDEKISITHPVRSLKILLKEKSSPKEITIATMLGIFLGVLPLFSVHSVTILFFATRLKLNRMIALNVSHLCMPPIVPALALEAGYYLRHGTFLTEMSIQSLGHEAPQRLYEYIIGATVLAPIFSILTGLIVYVFVITYKKLFTA